MQFLVEGVDRGQPGLLAVFEKRPSDYLKTNPLGEDIARQSGNGSLHVMYLRPLDLSLDETLEEVRTVVLAHGVKRVVIDSLSGLELALAPAFREDFRETLHRMVAMLTAMGITLLFDGGSGGLLHRSAVQPPWHGLFDRRHHSAALCRT